MTPQWLSRWPYVMWCPCLWVGTVLDSFPVHIHHYRHHHLQHYIFSQGIQMHMFNISNTPLHHWSIIFTNRLEEIESAWPSHLLRLLKDQVAKDIVGQPMASHAKVGQHGNKSNNVRQTPNSLPHKWYVVHHFTSSNLQISIYFRLSGLSCWNIQVNLISVNPLIMTWVFSIHFSYCYTYIYDVYMSCDICLIWIFISCSHLIFLFKTEMWVSLVFTLITPYSYYLIVNLF